MAPPSVVPCVCHVFHSWYVPELDGVSGTALSSSLTSAPHLRMGQARPSHPGASHPEMPVQAPPVGPLMAPRAPLRGLVCFRRQSAVCPLTSDPELFVPTIPSLLPWLKTKWMKGLSSSPAFMLRGSVKMSGVVMWLMNHFGPETNSKIHSSSGPSRALTAERQ